MTTPDHADHTEHTRLIDGLDHEGKLPAEWVTAFRAVPRRWFVPDAIWVGDEAPLTPLTRRDDPRAWLDAVYSDQSITTQIDDGATPPGRPGRYPTSSTSMPSIMAAMLDRAGVSAGMRVLEIGTGTGWNAALLAARVGDENVTTIEVDSGIANHARKALANAGFDLTVVTGDGTDGYLPNAPYDRVLATCAVQRVPYAWVAQAPGGRIVTPWGNAYDNGALLTLDVGEDGTASGRFGGGSVAFMWLRDQRRARGWLAEHADEDVDYDERLIDWHPYELNYPEALFAVGVQVPDCHNVLVRDADGDPYHAVLWLFHPDTRSRAYVDVEPDAHEFTVRQYGSRRLWDEVEAAHAWWVGAGRPERTRFGLTVTPHDQWTWLDGPEHRVPSYRPTAERSPLACRPR